MKYQRVPMPAANLEETVVRYNSFVESGVDADFDKPTPRYRIEKPPFYAAWATPVVHDTRAGLRIDPACRVIDMNGEVIPGLYCGGESAGGFSQHGLARAACQGYIAGSEPVGAKHDPGNGVRTRLVAGGSRIRTVGPSRTPSTRMA
jgi:succinate dehydrogenase/fumarate reductase flavoprotein subunit